MLYNIYIDSSVALPPIFFSSLAYIIQPKATVEWLEAKLYFTITDLSFGFSFRWTLFLNYLLPKLKITQKWQNSIFASIFFLNTVLLLEDSYYPPSRTFHYLPFILLIKDTEWKKNDHVYKGPSLKERLSSKFFPYGGPQGSICNSN